jgi:hypothetical protein
LCYNHATSTGTKSPRNVNFRDAWPRHPEGRDRQIKPSVSRKAGISQIFLVAKQKEYFT